MAMDNKDINFSTLSWVKQEIDETLQQARHALEEYVENPDDATQLQFCINYLHQITGTLQMVELYGASLFTEEMEQLSQAIQENEVSSKDDAYEVLMRGILQMPDYLEKILGGMKDDPVILLPLLNDLRAARGANLMSENALFAPDLDSIAPISLERDASGDIQSVAKNLRHPYQIGLLGWYRSQKPKQALSKILEVITGLERVSGEEDSARLWWVSRGVVESLIDGGLETSVALKKLMGQVDRTIKRIIDDGESAAQETSDLLKNLLYYVARSSSRSERVREVKQHFNLGGALPSQDEIEQAREQLRGPNTELLESVTAAINEDLARVKDALDLFLRSRDQDVGELQTQVEVLTKTADTLGMLGLGVQRKIVQDQVAVLQSVVAGEQEADEGTLMAIAGSLLYVESTMEGMAERGLNRVADEAEAQPVVEQQDVGHQLPNAEVNQIQATVLREISVDLAKAKDAIVSFIDAPWDHEMLVEVPRLFEQCRGGMNMIDLDGPARLLGQVNRYIQDVLLDNKVEPTQDTLDHLADAIASIEYYLEAILENRPKVEFILGVANESLTKLGYGIDLGVPANDSAPSTEQPVAEAQSIDLDLAEPETDSSAEVVLDAGDETIEDEFAEEWQDLAEQPEATIELNEVELEAEPDVEDEFADEWQQLAGDDTVATGSEEITAQEVSVEPEPAQEDEDEQEITLAADEAQAPDQAEVQTVTMDEPTLMDDIDEDILDIFVEEAEEELKVINEILPQWKNNTSDEEGLSRIRRAFHTMKGSGRMVGAVVIGELSWSVENMLNRVLDHTIHITQDMIELIEDVVGALPVLVSHLRGGEKPDVDSRGLSDRAFALVEAGKNGGASSAEDSIIEEVNVSLDNEAESEEEASDAALSMDPKLYDIFRKESDGHLQEIHEFIKRCQAAGEHCQANDELVRSLHTLHGSARMAGADEIAEIGGIMEKYSKLLVANESSLHGEGLVALVEGVEAIEHLLGCINQGDNDLPNTAMVLDRLQTLYSLELKKQEERLAEEQEISRQAHLGAERESEDDAGSEYDDEIVEVFLEEGSEILDSSEMILQRWNDDRDNSQYVEEFQRELHTLKGGARMAGISEIGDLAHSVEALMVEIAEGQREINPAMFGVLHTTLDRLYQLLQGAQERRKLESAHDLIAQLEALRRGEEIEEVSEQQEDAPDQEEAAQNAAEAAPAEETRQPGAEVVSFPVKEAQEDVPAVIPPATPVAEKEKPKTKAKPAATGEQIRVRAELLDDLVNFAGEVSIYRARLEQQNGAFRFNLVELDQTVARLREQLRKLEIETEVQILSRHITEDTEYGEEFDPLEMDRYSTIQQLSRALVETTADISSIQGLLDNLVRENETLLIQQARVNTELQEGLMRTRMVSFETLVPRMKRLVRQTCNELKKKAELHIIGEQGELDRTLLERITAPLEHMLRNAIGHGLETPAERKKQGKPQTGNITITVSREGGDVVILVSDDGRGMNLEAIRAKAEERGLIEPDAELTDHDIMQFVLESGFSTAESVTQISGRGVGMDVVNSEIKQLGGSLLIDSRHGHGTNFTLRLPFTLAVNHALLVEVADDNYAIPLTSIEGIVRMSRDDLEAYFDDHSKRYEYAGHEYQVQAMSSLLGHHSEPLVSGLRMYPVLLVRAGDHRTAVQVDALRGSREIVVKSVGKQLSTLRGVSGATILGDGSVVLILDIGALIRVGVVHRIDLEEAAPVQESDEITVMVVDDSITVRKVTTRLLERNDMNVITAKDGVDAVAQLQEQIPDVMLLDIEMPRMDGFELATHIRNEERLKNIPIIMITSRTGDKHRKRAEEIGVNRYLGKPYQEADLLENIHALVKG